MPATLPQTTEAPFWGMNQRISERLLDSHWAKECLNVTISDGDIRSRPGLAAASFEIDASLNNPKITGVGEVRDPITTFRHDLLAVTSDSGGDPKVPSRTTLWLPSIGFQVQPDINNSYSEARIQFQPVRDSTYFIRVGPPSGGFQEPVRVAYFSAPEDSVPHWRDSTIPTFPGLPALVGQDGFLPDELVPILVAVESVDPPLLDGVGVPGDNVGSGVISLDWWAASLYNVFTGQETNAVFTKAAEVTLVDPGTNNPFSVYIVYRSGKNKSELNELGEQGWKQIVLYRKSETKGEVTFRYVAHLDAEIVAATSLLTGDFVGWRVTDDIPDIARDEFTLAPSRNGEPPKAATAILWHLGRLWLAVGDQLHWSETSHPLHFDGGSFVVVGTRHEQITFLKVAGDRIVVGKEHSIHAVSGDPPEITNESQAQYLNLIITSPILASGTLLATVVDSDTGSPPTLGRNMAVSHDNDVYFMGNHGLYRTRGGSAVRMSNALPRGWDIQDQTDVFMAIDEALGVLVIGFRGVGGLQAPLNVEHLMVLAIRGTPDSVAEAGWTVWAPSGGWDGWYGPFSYKDADGRMRILIGKGRNSITDLATFDRDLFEDLTNGIVWQWKTGKIRMGSGGRQASVEYFLMEYLPRIGNTSVFLQFTVTTEQGDLIFEHTMPQSFPGRNEVPIGVRAGYIQVLMDGASSKALGPSRISSFGFHLEPVGHL